MSKAKRSSSAQKGKKGGATGMQMPSQTVIAGAAGAVVGAALGGAAAVALTNEKTRKLVGNAVDTMADYTTEAVDKLDTVSHNADKLSEAREKLTESMQEPHKKKSK